MVPVSVIVYEFKVIPETAWLSGKQRIPLGKVARGEISLEEQGSSMYGGGGAVKTHRVKYRDQKNNCRKGSKSGIPTITGEWKAHQERKKNMKSRRSQEEIIKKQRTGAVVKEIKETSNDGHACYGADPKRTRGRVLPLVLRAREGEKN